MEQRASDPFFEQLKADVQEGIAQADRGESIDQADVWKHFELKAKARERSNPKK